MAHDWASASPSSWPHVPAAPAVLARKVTWISLLISLNTDFDQKKRLCFRWFRGEDMNAFSGQKHHLCEQCSLKSPPQENDWLVTLYSNTSGCLWLKILLNTYKKKKGSVFKLLFIIPMLSNITLIEFVKFFKNY